MEIWCHAVNLFSIKLFFFSLLKKTNLFFNVRCPPTSQFVFRRSLVKVAGVAWPYQKYHNLVLQKFQDIEENHILHMKEIIQSYSLSVDETHIQIGEVSVYTHAHADTQHSLKHSCGWSRCLADLKLCSLGSLCVISISVVFDLANNLTEKQEMVHSSFYAKQLKTDQNSLSVYRKSRHLPNTVPGSKKCRTGLFPLWECVWVWVWHQAQLWRLSNIIQNYINQYSMWTRECIYLFSTHTY